MSTKEDFRNILQSKFNNWEHPVDETNWSEMRNQLTNARKTSTRIKWAAVGSGIAVLAAIGSYALLTGHGKNQSVNSSGIKSQSTVVSSVNPSTVNENKTAPSNTVEPKNVAKTNEKYSNLSTVAPVNNGSSNSAPLASDNDRPVVAVNNGNALPSNKVPVNALSVSISGAGSICSGSLANLCANITGGIGEVSFIWQPGNLTSKCIAVSPGTTTIYTLSVTDNSGTISKTASVVVNAAPQISFTSDIQKGCSPINVQFRDHTTVASGSIASWSWNFGNGDASNTENPVEYFHNTGNYNVTLTVISDNGCSSTLQMPNMVSVYAHPKASFTVSTQPSTSMGTPVQFKDGSTDTYGISSWYWNFYDGTDNTSNLENPSHTYSDTGLHYTRLVVTDINGCKDSATNCLAIAPIFNLYIPTAFSPNGDHRNDAFKPQGQYVKSFEMYIFNMQSMQVYHTDDINQGWNGTMTGSRKVCPEGTYIYRIFVADTQNKNHVYTGVVNLLK